MQFCCGSSKLLEVHVVINFYSTVLFYWSIKSLMAYSIGKSTVGGCSFDMLCDGDFSNYACDNLIDLSEEPRNVQTELLIKVPIKDIHLSEEPLNVQTKLLVKVPIKGLQISTKLSRKVSTKVLRKGPTLRKATKLLIKHIKDCIRSIEIGRGRKVEKFYIGKTLTHKRKKMPFDHMASRTWKLSDGISNRFKKHRDKGYGRDGMVVLTVVTQKTIPPNIHRQKTVVKQELYAFALENRLIQHFLIKRDDPRIANESLHSGGNDRNKSIGYPLYMAFRLEDSNPEEVYPC